MRIRNNPKALKIIDSSGLLIKTYPYLLNKNTVLELGMGKGEMVTEMAQANPNINYIGVEKYATVAAKAALKSQNLNLKNFFMILDDIKNLPDIFQGKVKTIWLTFSDPWPKARHEKRRLTYKAFLNIYEKVLSKDGILKFKTDNDFLFNYSLESLQENNWIICELTTDLHNSDFVENNFMTGYEKKWSSIGKKINYLEAKKI